MIRRIDGRRGNANRSRCQQRRNVVVIDGAAQLDMWRQTEVGDATGEFRREFGMDWTDEEEARRAFCNDVGPRANQYAHASARR